MIKELTWDSAFFDYKIGEWIVNDDLEINPTAFDLVYVKSSDPVAPQLNGFQSVYSETRVVFAKQLISHDTMQQNIRSVSATDNIDRLYELAYESGKYSRFKLDGKFGIDKFEKLYRAWVDNSLSHRFADEVVVCSENNVLAGFATCKIKNGFAEVGLISVAPDQQGKGIGKRLLKHIENILVLKGITELRIPTQLENNTACAFYSKLNYTIVETIYIKHYWKINDTF
jgi:dTDP-4-amino-4,6-dideoxy-D-galactose acyltransferase